MKYLIENLIITKNYDGASMDVFQCLDFPVKTLSNSKPNRQIHSPNDKKSSNPTIFLNDLHCAGISTDIQCSMLNCCYS